MKIKKSYIFVIGLLLILVFTSVDIIHAKPGSGAIWTTNGDCGGEKQDVNHYGYEEWVYINGANFDPGDYYWYIIGKPGGASLDPGIKVAEGTYTVGADGAFCFPAYTIGTCEDSPECGGPDFGEYSVKFGDAKNDNYRVKEEEIISW